MRRSLSLLVVLVAVACQQDEADQPVVETREAITIGSDRAVLQATLIAAGPIKPVKYGFVWSTVSDVNAFSAQGSFMVGEGAEDQLLYSYELTGLLPVTTYFVKAFATTNGTANYYYGEEITFTTTLQTNFVRTPVTRIIATKN
ncbi:MAG: hypothetical protein O9262_10625 [Cyclobacteriaceae bacterium]|nr:hypothetical protein [Cyclobacteriaceae bacterium]